MALNSNITGRYIAFLRKERGLSQESFAERIGVTSHAVTSWESGRRAMHRAVVDRFLAVAEALRCSASEREDLYGAVRADQFLHDLYAAADDDAVQSLFGTSMPGRMRDWLIGVFSRNRLISDTREYALGPADLVQIRNKMTQAVHRALQVGENMDHLHVLLLFLARSGRVPPAEAGIGVLLTNAFERLDNPVARRDVAIALAELGEARVMRRYIDLSEDDEQDGEANLRWMAAIDQETLPGPEVLRRLVAIMEQYEADPPVEPLVEVTLRTIGQLLTRRGALACDSVTTLSRLARVLERILRDPGAGELVARRAGYVRRQVTEIAAGLATAFDRYTRPER